MSKKNGTSKNKETKATCGIIMPISPIDGCSAEHWAEVLSILQEVIQQADFKDKLVSDADDSGIIQKRIIQNIYNNEIVICDVSGKNPNVMFELGLRLAFDKPTIIVKDDQTDYSFDTSVIEHIEYPRDLRFTDIVEFKKLLEKKVTATFESSKSDPNYTTFLKHFGEYKVTNLESKEITSDKYILSTLEDLRTEIGSIKRNQIVERDLLRRGKKFKNEAHIIVKKRIDQYLAENGFKHSDQIMDQEKMEDLFKFLEKFEDVRGTCGDPNRLREVIDDLLLPF